MNNTPDSLSLFDQDDEQPTTHIDDVSEAGEAPAENTEDRAQADTDQVEAADENAPSETDETNTSEDDAQAHTDQTDASDDDAIAAWLSETPAQVLPAVPPTFQAPGEPQPAASSPTRTVGSEAEVDAWLAGSAPERSTGAWAPTDSDADAAMAAWLAADPDAPASPDTPAVISAGKVDRVRPKRRPLVPRWVPWVVLGILLVGGITAGIVAFSAARSRVIVPTLAGLQTQAARERLATVGLVMTVSDRRFSTLPVDTVLSQTPDVGSQVPRGSTVTVVVSAGTEEFTMLDVVGMGLSLARQQLEQRGLQIQVEPQASDQPSDTVLASNPAAGAPVHTGDIVKLTVATGSTTSTTTQSPLVPYTMTGVKIVIDPAPGVAGQPDTPLEVTRRLQSLLEASGATVTTTRSTTDTGTTATSISRQQRAVAGAPTVSVGLDVISTGEAGMAVNYPSSSVATSTAAASAQLASQIASGLAAASLPARQVAGGNDTVLSATNAPYSRVTLGSTASAQDIANFKDPGWADKVARAIYQGIAAIYGVKNASAP